MRQWFCCSSSVGNQFLMAVWFWCIALKTTWSSETPILPSHKEFVKFQKSTIIQTTFVEWILLHRRTFCWLHGRTHLWLIWCECNWPFGWVFLASLRWRPLTHCSGSFRLHSIHISFTCDKDAPFPIFISALWLMQIPHTLEMYD